MKMSVTEISLLFKGSNRRAPTNRRAPELFLLLPACNSTRINGNLPTFAFPVLSVMEF